MVESTRNKTQITDQLLKDKAIMEGEMHDEKGEKKYILSIPLSCTEHFVCNELRQN